MQSVLKRTNITLLWEISQRVHEYVNCDLVVLGTTHVLWAEYRRTFCTVAGHYDVMTLLLTCCIDNCHVSSSSWSREKPEAGSASLVSSRVLLLLLFVCCHSQAAYTLTPVPIRLLVWVKFVRVDHVQSLVQAQMLVIQASLQIWWKLWKYLRFLAKAYSTITGYVVRCYLGQNYHIFAICCINKNTICINNLHKCKSYNTPINVNSCHWKTCKLMFTIARTQVPALLPASLWMQPQFLQLLMSLRFTRAVQMCIYSTARLMNW